MTLSDLARAADLPRATARRILFTLERGGFVATDGKLFTLTPHVLTLAASYLRSSQVVTVLQPVLDRIATTAQEISSLSVLDGDEVVFIARGSPARVFSAGLDIGYRLPAFCTSVGRVMLGLWYDAVAMKQGKLDQLDSWIESAKNVPKRTSQESVEQGNWRRIAEKALQLTLSFRGWRSRVVRSLRRDVGCYVSAFPSIRQTSQATFLRKAKCCLLQPAL